MSPSDIRGNITLSRFDSTQDDLDTFDQYENLFDPMKTDRQARRRRKPKAKHTPKKAQDALLREIAAETGVESGGFETTYHPSKYEAGWLLQSLRTFYDQKLISDVLALVKGGKEASVYRCEAHPVTGLDFVAAKVYRPRMFRSLSNDAMYREGRQVLTDSGAAVKETDHRTMRAIGKKSGFGQQVAHTSWLMHEFTAMQQLQQAGAAVPQPIAASSNAILMDYIGDESIAAPILADVRLRRDEAAPLFDDVLRNIALMLDFDMIHGDLSAYNILYWDGAITLIDFPQVSHLRSNSRARFILERDVTRVCDYFAAQGYERDPQAITSHLWGRYVQVRQQDQDADLSRMLPEDEEEN
jgi:RIO kinase 1